MVRQQDDFYDAVNGAWEKTAVILTISHAQVVLVTCLMRLKSGY